MTETEIQIVSLLKQGLSYSQIQERLQVSSKTIAATKKKYFPSAESNDEVLSGDTFPEHPIALSIEIPATSSDSFNNNRTNDYLPTLKTQNHMKKEDNYDEYDNSTKLELGKYRIKLEHELEMQKLQDERESKEREHALREKEFDLKSEESESDRRRKGAEEEKRSLLSRIKSLIASCEDGEYTYKEADDLLKDTNELISACESNCSRIYMHFQVTESYSLLNKIKESLINFMDEMNEDDTWDLTFVDSFRRQIKYATFDKY